MLLQLLKRGNVRTKDVVSGEKLRGGFYSPDVLVDLCLDRVDALTQGRTDLRLFEPSIGDGAFLRGLKRHLLGNRVSDILGVELLAGEAEEARRALAGNESSGQVITANVLEWNQSTGMAFDVAVGNPPYVRFQFLSAEDRQRAIGIGIDLGVPGTAVSNLWIPVFLLALSRLEVGGAFSMIVPMEFMTGVSASRVRAWLLDNARELSIDLFKPGTFPAVLQEVIVLSGRRAGGPTDASNFVRFYDHNGNTKSWQHAVSAGASTWTGYLLSADELAAWQHAVTVPGVRRLGDVARFTVSTVTGANNFFCVNSATADEHDLNPWALPLLPRIKHAPGLVFEASEHALMSRGDAAAWMVSFAADAQSPLDSVKPAMYVLDGELEELHQRFKCRVREPWFRVPVVSPGTLLLSKRSDVYPRVIVNRAGVVTTDTVYRGVVSPGSGLIADDVAASFHNSLTLLSAEIMGRSFGGGVLELVPSEIASLLIPVSPEARNQLAMLDLESRKAPQSDSLIDATDKLLPKWIPGLDPELVALLGQARQTLSSRRTQRSHGAFYAGTSEREPAELTTAQA
jgi:adenine-specific DNA-methyltransferase